MLFSYRYRQFIWQKKILINKIFYRDVRRVDDFLSEEPVSSKCSLVISYFTPISDEIHARVKIRRQHFIKKIFYIYVRLSTLLSYGRNLKKKQIIRDIILRIIHLLCA